MIGTHKPHHVYVVLFPFQYLGLVERNVLVFSGVLSGGKFMSYSLTLPCTRFQISVLFMTLPVLAFRFLYSS